ncbi:MAG: LamG domain-containing protein [Nitrospinae bacterium]|nr:LamG domain-containing protein [Nitrospinota bacterium]
MNSYGESSESSQVSAIPKLSFQVDTGGTLTAGLVSYYKLEDVNDFWGSRHLTNNGSVPFGPGKVNNAATFGGTSYLGYDTDNYGISGGASSFAFWIKINTAPATNESQIIFEQGGGDTTKVDFDFWYKDNGGIKQILFFRQKNSVASDTITVNQTLTVGTYYHIVCTYDNTNLRLYLNNSLVGGPTAASGNGIIAGRLGLHLGQEIPTTNYPFKGLLDEVGIWNRVLSTTEISDLYNGGAGQTMN